MGCGSSQVGIATSDEQTQNQDETYTPRQNHKGSTGDSPTQNGVSPRKMILDSNNSRQTCKDPNANTVNMDQTPVPKSVAFDVSLDGQDTALFPKSRPLLPRRLQVLDPLDVPKLSAEQLAEKQRLADEKRTKVLQKRANASKKASRRRQELMKAREFEIQHHVQQEKVLDDQQRLVELKRESRLREIQDKQKLREERAKRARERAKRLNNPDEADDIDVEKDDHFNASDTDSWLGDNEANERGSSGRQKHRLSKRPTASASTVDSYDAAFQRKPKPPSQQVPPKSSERDDDFFGS